MEALRTQPKQLEEVIERYKKLSVDRRLTPIEAMTWGSAVIVRSTGDYDFARRMERDNNLNPLNTSVYGAFHSDSFEFTRMRFLLCVVYVFPNHRLIPLGEKLHQKAPADLPLLRVLVILQQPQAFPEMLTKGRPLAESLLKADPDHLTSILCAGTFYLRAFQRTKNPADANRGIALYEKAFALSSSLAQKKNIQAQVKAVSAELRTVSDR